MQPVSVGGVQTVEFDNVVFQHQTAVTKALDGISFTASLGQTIAFVGPSGSGKTTIFNALTGLSAETGFGNRERANVGVIKVPDSRVDQLAELYKPKKTTYAEVSFVASGPGVGIVSSLILRR